MGQAKRRGTAEERKAQAIAAGRSHAPRLDPDRRVLLHSNNDLRALLTLAAMSGLGRLRRSGPFRRA